MKTFKKYALAAVGLVLPAETVRNFLRRRRYLATTGLAGLFLIAGTLSGLSHVPGVVLSGSGTATIDGVFNASEWTNAGTLTFAANLPEGGTAQAILYAMNNRSNLFLAVRYARSFLDPFTALFFDFDNNHDGGLANGEDAVFFDNTLPTGFRDRFRPASDDTANGGTNDGAGARGNAGGFTIIELSHPLNSGDPHDFSLVPGNTVGFRLVLNIHNGTNLGTTTFPPSTGMGDIVITTNHPPTVQDLAVNVPANMATPIHLVGIDADGDALTFGFSSPAHGTLSGTPPNLTYTPSLNFIGTDSFTYKAADGLAESGIAKVTLTIKNGVSINDAFVTEGNRGRTNAIFTVSITAPVTGELKIDYVTDPRTATAGTDYVTTQGSLVFVQGGLKQQTIAVPVIGDTLFEIHESFSVNLSSSSDVFIFDDFGLGGIINDDPSVGTSALTPADSIVRVGERVNLSLTWVHPIQWRVLDSLDLLIIDDEGEALAVRWQEPDDTFSLFNPAADRFIRTAQARSSARFETSAATLFLDQSSSQGSGPTGHSVTVNYSVVFKPKAADRIFRVEAFATDDDGNQQGFEEVGTIAVLRK